MPSGGGSSSDSGGSGKGRQDAESQYGADSYGSYDSSQNTSDRGGNNNSNIVDEVALTGKRGTAWAPSESLVTVGLMPQYSRTKQSEFNLKKFVKGEHTLPGKDGFI